MKKPMIFIALIALLTLGCKKTFTGEVLTERELYDTEALPYYFQAEFHLEGEQEPRILDYGVELDGWENNRKNSYQIYNDSTYSELYSGWNFGHFMMNPNSSSLYDSYMEDYMMIYGYLYSQVVCSGFTFCFFHPDGNEKWDEAVVNEMFVEGKELEFGFSAGNVEIGYLKNNDLLGRWHNDPRDRGLLSTPASNEEGYFRIEKVVDAVGRKSPYSINLDETTLGKQVTVSFKSTLLRQYTKDYTGEIEGEATIFIPVEEK